jgi:hypothetical protein
MGIHCSHFHGRGKWSVRFEPDNAMAACFGCHRILGSQPDEHRRLFEARLGQERYEVLLEKANDTKLGRLAKREAKEIAKYYRDQHKNMRTQREIGIEGRIEIVGYF